MWGAGAVKIHWPWQKRGLRWLGLILFDTKGKIELVQATLQEYMASNPQEKFDLATVFLWNISHSEEKGFMESLAKVCCQMEP